MVVQMYQSYLPKTILHLKNIKFTASDINDFTSFQLKIVMKGTNSAYPPVIRDMRGIALAI